MDLEALPLSKVVFLDALVPRDGKRGPVVLQSPPGSVAPNEAYYQYMVAELQSEGLVIAVEPALTAAAGYGRALRSSWQMSIQPDLAADLVWLREQLLARFAELRRRDDRVSEQLSLWLELARVELQAYLAWELASHRFDPSWAEYPSTAIEQGLTHFSIGQMFYFCWFGVRELASRHLRQPGPFEVYKEALAASLEHRLVRAVRDGWEVRQYSRQWGRRSNAVADSFSQRATGLGDRFLSDVPSVHALSTLF